MGVAQASIGLLLIIVGVALMLHHLIIYGIVFDLGDLVGHDWLGLGSVFIGGFVTYKGLAD